VDQVMTIGMMAKRTVTEDIFLCWKEIAVDNTRGFSGKELE
jgi:hypothetical protein